MCTAVTYQTNHFYFGRTLDYESSYGEEIVILPRKFPLSFLHRGTVTQHYAIMGIAHVANQYPLFYDAINEKGLCMAGLNFVGNAHYVKSTTEENEVAQLNSFRGFSAPVQQLLKQKNESPAFALQIHHSVNKCQSGNCIG